MGMGDYHGDEDILRWERKLLEGEPSGEPEDSPDYMRSDEDA